MEWPVVADEISPAMREAEAAEYRRLDAANDYADWLEAQAEIEEAPALRIVARRATPRTKAVIKGVCWSCKGRGIDFECDGHWLTDGRTILFCGCEACKAPDRYITDPTAEVALRRAA